MKRRLKTKVVARGSVYGRPRNKRHDRSIKGTIRPGLRRTTNPHMHQGRIIRKVTYYRENRANRSDKNPSSGL